MQRADKRKYHYIYKITRDDGRYYIGMHSTDNLEDGYFGSGKRITRSIKKHGVNKHKKQILEFLPTRIALREREKQIITEEMRNDIQCMNIAPGGGGGFIDEHHQLKCSSAGASKGGKSTSVRRTNNNDFDIKFRAALSNGVKSYLNDNKQVCGERQKRITLAAASAEANEKRKRTLAERNHSKGEKNSQFGTCWVTKDSKPIKIKKEQLDEYLANGYSRGRK